MRSILFICLVLVSCVEPPKVEMPQAAQERQGSANEPPSNVEGLKEQQRQANIPNALQVAVVDNRFSLMFSNGVEKEIMDYDPLIKNIKKDKIDFVSDLNYRAKISLDKLSDSEKQSLFQNATMFYEDGKAEANFLEYTARTGGRLIRSDKAILSYEAKVLAKPYKMLGEVATAIVVNSEGEVIQEIEGAGDVKGLTMDSKYLLAKEGGEWGDGGAQHIQDKMKIFDTDTGEMVFSTTNLSSSPMIIARDNYFTLISSKGDNNILCFIFNPRLRKVFHKIFASTERAKFKKYTDNGILMKDNSISKFDSEWESISFEKYNETNFFGEYENKTEIR